MQIDNILKKLKSKISAIEYSSYIALMEYDESASRTDIEVFYVPNIFVANWIKSNYLDIIADAFVAENSNGIKPDIHIKIKEQKNHIKTLKPSKIPSNMQSNAMSLNPFYTFENFIVGKSNEHAQTIAKLISRQQGSAYNPVIFYGKSGLGKTHLLNAIGNFASEQGKNVLYASAEDFLNDFTEKIRRGTMDRFRDKYRKCDYMLLDDVQFFGGKEGMQEELLNTFNALYATQKQIVMTSDKPPKEIKGLEARLRSRFEGGVMAEITHPELETKISIIESKCEINRISLDKEVIDYIASNIHGNVRQIEGILSTINAHINLSPESDVLKIAKNVLKNYQIERTESIAIDNIIKIVSKELNIKPSEITSKARTQRVVLARQIAIYLAKSLTINSVALIATELGLEDHSSASKALKAIEKKIANNDSTKALVEDIKNKIKQQNDSH